MYVFVCLSFIILVVVAIYFILFYYYYYYYFIYRQSVYCSSSYYIENADLSILGRHCLWLILSTAGVQVVHGSRTGSLLAKSNNAIMALVMAWRRDSWHTGALSPSSPHPSLRITTYRFLFLFLFFFGGGWGGGESIGDLINGVPYLLAILNGWTVPEFVWRPCVKEGNILISM